MSSTQPAAAPSPAPSERPRPGGAVDLLATLTVVGLLGGLLGGGIGGVGAAPATRAGTPLPALRAGEHLLVWDRAGGGRAVATVGDLATAGTVAVVVPGVANDLTTFEHGLGRVVRRAPLEMARRLAAELRRQAGTAPVAVVAWQDYDPPAGVDLDAAREDAARDGAGRLASFVTALRTARPQVRVTLVGHSYGAITAGLAARRLGGSVPLTLALLGAPGAGADTAAEFGGARVLAALATDDWIRRLPQVRLLGLGHGRHPASPAFGATALPTAGVHGHDHYLDPDAATLPALAAACLDAPAGPFKT